MTKLAPIFFFPLKLLMWYLYIIICLVKISYSEQALLLFTECTVVYITPAPGTGLCTEVQLVVLSMICISNIKIAQ